MNLYIGARLCHQSQPGHRRPGQSMAARANVVLGRAAAVGLFYWAAQASWVVPASLGQAIDSLQIERLDVRTARLSWSVDPLVPAPGPSVVPNFRIYFSTDLQNWFPAGEAEKGPSLAGRVEKTILIKDDSPPTFFRIETSIQLAGKDFSRKLLKKALLAGADLFAARLENSDLSETVLRHAHLQGVDARAANFRLADLSGADLFGAVLAGATFTDAKLIEANLSFCDLSEANLTGADLTGADLRFTTLHGAELNFAFLHETRIDHQTRLDPKWRRVWNMVNQKSSGANLNEVDLSFANLQKADLRETSLRKADLSAADLRGADLSGADLAGAELRFANFRSVSLDGRTRISQHGRLVWEVLNLETPKRILQRADLSSALLVKVNLPEANLTQADLNLSILWDANFEAAILNAANLRQADLTGANLQRADLRFANLTGANLARANLRESQLTGAQLSGAFFKETIMPDGTIRNR